MNTSWFSTSNLSHSTTGAHPAPWRAKRPLRMAFMVTLIALLAAVAQSAWAEGPGGHGGRHGQGGGFMQGRMVERMLDRVSATPEQRAEVKRITQLAAQDLRGMREANQGMRQRGLELLAAPNVDANAVEAHRQQMMQRHDQSSRRMTQAMVDISRVLTPEQRRQLADTMARRQDMKRRHMQERRQADGLPKS
jgi:periplasmic protein CpxP/Spy